MTLVKVPKVEAGKLLVEIDEGTLEFKGNQLAAKIPYK